MGMIMEGLDSHSGFGELLDLSRQSCTVGVLLDNYSYDHHQGLWPCCYSPEAVDFYVVTRARAASGTIIKCLRNDSDFSLPSKAEDYCGIQRVLVQDPPRQNLAKEPVQVKDLTDAFQVRLVGRTQEIIRLPTEVRFNQVCFSSFATTTTASVSPPPFPTVFRTVSISEGSNILKTRPNLENIQHFNTNNLHARNHRRAASESVLHTSKSHFLQTWPENNNPPFSPSNRQEMVKKRRSLQAIFVPSFLQAGALSLSPTLLSPTSPSLALPPSPSPVTSSTSFKQRARAHSAAAGKAARVLGEEAKDAYVSLRSGFTSNTTSVSGPPPAGVVLDNPQIRPVSPPSASSRRKGSISNIIQAIPSFSSGITGISIDADVQDTPPTTPVQASPSSPTGLSFSVKGPRSSPPPSYLIDDDPFANLSGAPSEVVIRSTSSGGASGSSSAADMLPPPAPPIPSSPLTLSGGSQGLDYFKGKARSGSLSLPSSPPATTPGFSHLPPPPSPHALHGQLQQQQQNSPQRAFGGRGHPRPATQRPAFSSRPSLPSLNSLANMNIVLSRRPRKGKVGAGLPFEPWDNVDTPPDSAIDSPASLSPLPLSGVSTPPPPHSTATNEVASSSTSMSLDLQPQPQSSRTAMKPLLPSQILALGSLAHDMEMSMMYDSPTVPVVPATSLPVPIPTSTSGSTPAPTPTSASSTSSSLSSTSTSTITQADYFTSTSSGPPQLPPLSLDFITHSSVGYKDGQYVDNNGEEVKSPLELEFEAAVSPLSAEGDGFRVASGGTEGRGYEMRDRWSEIEGEEREERVEHSEEPTAGSRWEGDAQEQRGRRQSVVAVGSLAGHTESDDILDMDGPAILAIRRNLEEGVQELDDPFIVPRTESSVSHPRPSSQIQQAPTDMTLPSPPESASVYGYGYGYGYTPQHTALLGSPVPQDSYHNSFSYSSNQDAHAYSYSESTPLFSPPPSDWSRSRSLSSTSISSIDEALDLDFSELKDLSDASEQHERQGVVDEHQNFNVLSALQYSPDVSIRSPAISANQFSHGVYEKERKKDNSYSPNLLGDEHNLLSADSFFSRTRSSSFTPSIGSASQHDSSSHPSEENLRSSDEFGVHENSAGGFLDLQNPHGRQPLLHGDVALNDGGCNVSGEERIESCAVWDAGKFGRVETSVGTCVDEGLGTIVENESGKADMSGTAERGNGLEVVEDERENEVANLVVGIGGRRSASSWLSRDDEGLALLQARQETGEGEANLNLERGLMFGMGMNASGGADTSRDDNNGTGPDMPDLHGNKFIHPQENILPSISPPTTTGYSEQSTIPPVGTTTTESRDITIISPSATQHLELTWEQHQQSGSELAQSRPSATSSDNNITQPIPVLGLIASESQDHNPETAIDGAPDSNINQLQLQLSHQDSLHLAPYPSRSSSLTTFSSGRSQSQSPSPSSVTSPRLHSQYFSASSSASVSPRSSISLREGEYTHPSPDFSEQEGMTRGMFEQSSVEGYSYGNGSGGAQGGYSSSSRGGNSAAYHQSSSTSRTAYRGYASTGYPGSGGGGGGGGSGGDDREDEERRRRRKLAEMGYITRSSSRRYADATSGEEDEETRVYGVSHHTPPVPSLPKSSGGSSTVQRYSSTAGNARFPVTSSSSRSVSDYDSDSSDDDVPLAQRIPGALKAQSTIRRQVIEEREKRKQQRRDGGRQSEVQDDYRLRQDTLRPAAASSAGGYSMGGGMSSSQEAALLAASSVAASSGQPHHLRDHPGRRQRTMTLPSKAAAESTAPSSFNADDLVRKLQHVQMAEKSSPVSSNLTQAMQSRSKSISRTSGDLGDSIALSSSPVGGLSSRSRSIRHPPQQAPASPMALSPPSTTMALPTLRPMRSFRRPSTTDSVRPVVPLQADYATRASTDGGPIPRRSLSQSRGTAERTYVRDEVVPPMPALPSRSPARTSVDEQAYALQQHQARKLVKSHQPGSLSRRPSVDIDGRPAQPLNVNTSALSPQSAVQQQASALSSARSTGPGSLMRFFVFNLQQFNMVHVGPGTSAGDVIDMLESEGALTGWAGVGGWMVWEIAQDFGMERPVRSFELISEVQASWLKDKTVNYFLLRMTPLAVPLSRHAIPSSSPTHSGYVEWEVKRGKWSKRWMMLKEHSLWMSKRDNGRDEVLVCSLSNFDAYQITRNHRAPKPFAFAVKSTDNLSFFEDASDYMHSFSCQEKDGVIWLEKILIARSYVLHQERNVLFNPKSANGNGASVSRSATRARKMSTAGHRSPSSPNAPLVPMPPLQAVLSQTATSRNDVFEPGSLLAKHP